MKNSLLPTFAKTTLALSIFLLLPMFWVQGQSSGNALNFDGSDDYLSTASTVTLFGSTPTTIELWAKQTATGNFRPAIGIGNNNFYLNFHGGTFTPWRESGYSYNSGGTISAGVWAHWAVTYDGAGTFRAYKNGSPTPTPTFSQVQSAITGTVYVGARGPSAFFNGEIDEVRIWTVERTQAQIAANMTTSVASNEPGLVQYFKFNQGTAGGDNTGLTSVSATTGSNGTLNNMALTGTTSNWVAGFVSPNPEVNLQGNGLNIFDGDTSPSTADHTDFGSTLVDGGTVVRTFTIQNLGGGVLNLNGSPSLVDVFGSNPSDFTVTLQPTSPVSGNSSTTFQVTFNPSAAGLRRANITFGNDDSDEQPYNFDIQGMGLASIEVANLSAADCGNTSCTSDDTYTADITINYTSNPQNGTLVLGGADILGTPPSVYAEDIGATSHTFTGVLLRADGQSISLTATFSFNGTTFENTNAGTAAACSENMIVAAGCGDVQNFTILANGVSGNGSPTWHLDLPGGDVTAVDVIFDDSGSEWQVVLNGGAAMFATSSGGSPSTPPCSGWVVDPTNCSSGGVFMALSACGSSVVACDINNISLADASACDGNGTTDGSDDTFTADATVTFAFASATGNLVLRRGTDIVASKPATDLQCSTTWTFDDVEMSADGSDIVLTAEFSATCSFTSGSLGTAPVSCSCTPATEICNGMDDDCDTEIDENNTLAINLTAIGVTCAGGTNGTIFTTTIGGTAPFTYIWSTTPPKTSPNINLLNNGNYSVTITDAGGCIKTGSTTITSPPILTMSVSATPTTATITSGGGTGTHLYNRTGATTFQPNPVFGSLNPGATYIFKTKDANGCQKSVIKKLPTSMAPAGGGNNSTKILERNESENFDKNQFAIFPNPASEVLNLAFTNDDEAVAGRMEIFNQIGQRVFVQNMKIEVGEEGVLSIGHLPEGSFHLIFWDENGGSSSKSFVKIN